MKKFLLLGIICVLCIISAQAQDVIFRSSTDSIQAQVLTVGTSEVTYRKWNNLEGPIYSISVDEIAAIRYINGSYDFFSNKNVLTQERPNQSHQMMLTRSGNTYYYDKLVMNKQATLEWLETQNCYSAYSQFRSGYKTANAGWALMGVGLGLDLCGTIILFRTGRAIGGIFAGLGAALEIACIPTIAVGYSKMHQTVNVYNMTCNSTAKVKPYWTLQASENGIGIAYKF